LAGPGFFHLKVVIYAKFYSILLLAQAVNFCHCSLTVQKHYHFKFEPLGAHLAPNKDGNLRVLIPQWGFNSPKLASSFDRIFPVDTPWLATGSFI
jgi:hypothetical protein